MPGIVKKYLFIIFFLTAIKLLATTYFIDASSGDDSNTGTSITKPWKTINKVNHFNFLPGDSLLFKKGEIWKESMNFPSSGNSSAPIIIGSYGNGPMPIITGRDVYLGWNDPATWTYLGNNLWYREQSYNPQRLWINGEEVLRNEVVDSLDGTRYMWAWENSRLYVYSVSNPATSFSMMETNVFYFTVRFENKAYIFVQDIDVQGGYSFAFALLGCSYITVKDCNIGAYSRQGILIRDSQGVSSTYVIIDHCELDSRFHFSYGKNKGIDDGIQISNGANDCMVRNSAVKDFGHTGIYLKGLSSSAKGVYNNKIYGNYISGENVTYQRGIGTDGLENKCRDNEFFNNIIKNTTVQNQINGNNNWIHHNIIDGIRNSPVRTFATARGIHLQAYGTNMVCHDNKIDNNLIMNCDEPGIYLRRDQNPIVHNYIRNNIIINCGRNSRDGLNDIAITIEDHNLIMTNYFYNNCLFNGDETAPVVYHRGTYVNAANFNNQVSTMDSAANNIQKDPLLTTSDSLYYYLSQNSPCIDAGIDVGLTNDFYGNKIFFGNAPDIGIHEYASTTGIPSERETNTNKFSLEQNYPNPFNPITTINYSIKEKGFVQLAVYDVLGKEIAVLVNEEKRRGNYSLKFNGNNLPSGVYFYTLRVNNFVQSRKMVLLR